MGPIALSKRYDIDSIYGVNFGGSGITESTEGLSHASLTIECPDEITQKGWRTTPMISWSLVAGRLSLRFSLQNICTVFLFTFVLAFEISMVPSSGRGVARILLASVPCRPACAVPWMLAK